MERAPVPSLPCAEQTAAPRRLGAALLAAVLALLAVVVAVLPSWRTGSGAATAQMSSSPVRDVALADAASVLGRLRPEGYGGRSRPEGYGGRSRPEGYGGRSRPESYGASPRAPLAALGAGIGWDLGPDHALPVFLLLAALGAGYALGISSRRGHGAASGLFSRRVPIGPPAMRV